MANQPTIMTVAADLAPERLAALVRDFSHDLERNGVQVLSSTPAPQPGDRGDPVTIGTIALALVTSGAVTAFIECLKAYLTRERTLAVKLTSPDGTVIEITGRNVKDISLQQALGALPPR